MTTTCPSCHGSGRRAADAGFHDVTKTKPSHYRQSNTKAEAPQKQQWPTTAAGVALANEGKDSNMVANETKERLIREIIEYEASHGQCTQTFTKKIRKQVRPRPS